MKKIILIALCVSVAACVGGGGGSGPTVRTGVSVGVSRTIR